MRSVVSFPKFGWRGERFTLRDVFSCLRFKFLLLEEKSEEVSRERGSLEDILEEQAGDGKKKGS